MKVSTPIERLGTSTLRMRLGAALQKHRVRRNMTQAQLAEFADLSLKHVGDIERGEANTSLEVLERLAAAVGWDPMDAFEGLNEPLSEGVRMLLLDELTQVNDRLRNMTKWLHALDPALQANVPKRSAETAKPEPEQRLLKGSGRPARKSRRQI